MIEARTGEVVRATGRFAGCVLATTGLLLLADAGATVAWQEPVSALSAARAQRALSGELQARFAAVHIPPAAHRTRGVAELRRLAARYRRHLDAGSAVGRIRLPTLQRAYVVVQGTDLGSLRRGPAHHVDTALPGEGATVAVAGHRTTYLAPFRFIDQLRRGDPIVMEMPYGRFTYRVQQRRVVAANALWVKRRVGFERLVLTACHPLHSAARRLVVFARLASSTA